MTHTGNARGVRAYQQVVGTVEYGKGPVKKWWQAFATDDGLTSGEGNAIGNYTSTTSSVPTQFWYAATEPTRLHRMVVEIEDTAGMAAADYGNITGSLTRGVQMKHIDSDGTTVLHDFTAQAVIKTNAGWAKYCYDVDIKTWGSGNDFLFVRWTFANAGTPVRLDTGERLAILLHDDFSGLVQHRFLFQGYRENTSSHAE